MSVSVFHSGAGAYGLLTSMMAAGSVIGALMVAARPRPGLHVLLIGALTFGLGCAAAAAMPNYASFGIVLMMVGIAAQTVTTSTNSYVQTSTEHHMRGRVTAILLAIALGGTPVGAPIVGWIADAFGPRWALGVGAASGILAAIVALIYLAARNKESPDTRTK
jgi:MFS family permease